jgi:carbon monoxide dehydrogenase subunit G
MKIENNFTVPLTPDEAWPLLLDVPRMARSMPGAELTETLGDRAYKGKVGVKLGPVRLTFAGEAKIEDLDEAAKSAKVAAKGADTSGRGHAQAKVDFRLVPDGAGTRVEIATDLQLAGTVAQYGRGAGLIGAVANQLIGQFAENLRQDIETNRPAAAPAAGPAPAAAPAPTPVKAKEISGFALLWAALRDWIRSLFKKKG